MDVFNDWRLIQTSCQSLARKWVYLLSVSSNVSNSGIMASTAAAMASEPDSLRPMGFAEIILTLTILLDVICILAVGLRTWQRVRERSLGVRRFLLPLLSYQNHSPGDISIFPGRQYVIGSG